jgi:hypothetical protein
MFTRRFLSCLAVGLALAVCAPAVQAQVPPVGGGGGASYHEYYGLPNDSSNQWTVGSAGNPVNIALDPSAGPWVKTLMGFNGAVINADDTGYVFPAMYWYTENIHIGGALSWTDWHEDISTPGWYISLVSITLADGSTPGGLTWSYTAADWQNHGGGLDLYFNSLTPGHTLTIQKQLWWIGDPNVQGDLFSGFITMNQYPTPEPATLGLLAMGLSAMYLRRRRTGK